MGVPDDRRLFLLDAYALIYRAYYAFIKNPRMTSQGFNASAVFGFTNTLYELIRKEQPSHIAVVFDPPGPTGRSEEFAEYKANREAQPEDITLSIPIIMNIVRGFRIPTLMVPGYEADDVIGTLAKRAESHGYQVFMVTPDKDYAQLVSDQIFMYKPGRQGGDVEILGPAEVREKFEVERPDQIIDLLGMMGDAVDNIPGIPGVGQKTAVKLIAQFGGMKGLYENTHEIKGKLREKIEANHDQAFLSRHLATIITDVPIDFDEEDLLCESPDPDQLRPIFEELEFRMLTRKILGGGDGSEASGPSQTANSNPPAAADEPASTSTRSPKTPPSDPAQGDLFAAPEDAFESAPALGSALQTIADVHVQYHAVTTPEQRSDLVALLRDSDRFAFDTETTGLNPHEAELVGMSFCTVPGTAYYVPVPADPTERTAVLEPFKELFASREREIVGQNIKYDLIVMAHHGIPIHAPLFDTMIAHYLINPEMRHNLDLLAETYLGYQPISIESLIGKKGPKQRSMRDVVLEEITPYACEDADLTLQLRDVFVPAMAKAGVQELYEAIEGPLIGVLATMETTGIRLDPNALNDLRTALEEEIADTQRTIYELAGTEFNIGSPRQLGEVLFDVLAIDKKPKKTKSGQYSTSEDVLVKLEAKHPIVGHILNYRSNTKLLSTYVDALPELVNPHTGRIHTTYNQAVAATGRLSSTAPNLQNIPIRTERGRMIRKAFVPGDSDRILVAADYSQIELRLVAALSEDENMIAAFRNGEDIHAATAARVFGVPLVDVTRDMRSKAKMVNFGIIYGISAFGLAQRLGIARGEAADIIKTYNAKFPGIEAYMQGSIEFAREHGYVETVMGRRRYLPDIRSSNAVVRGFAERNAINAPIQGSAADIIKKAMIAIQRELVEQGMQSRMMLQVHDELVFDVVKSEKDTLVPLIVRCMETAHTFSVPLTVDVGEGSNWLEAH